MWMSQSQNSHGYYKVLIYSHLPEEGFKVRRDCCHLKCELGEIPTLKTLQVFGIVPDGTLQLLKEALPHLQINCSHFTTIARPTVGNKNHPEIWGIKCQLTLQKPTCL